MKLYASGIFFYLSLCSINRCVGIAWKITVAAILNAQNMRMSNWHKLNVYLYIYVCVCVEERAVANKMVDKKVFWKKIFHNRLHFFCIYEIRQKKMFRLQLTCITLRHCERSHVIMMYVLCAKLRSLRALKYQSIRQSKVFCFSFSISMPTIFVQFVDLLSYFSRQTVQALTDNRLRIHFIGGKIISS